MGTALVAASRDVLGCSDLGDGLLSPAERARADRLTSPDDRLDHVASRVLARTLVADHAGVRAETVRLGQTCARCGGPHGRPQVVGLDTHVSWSRSAGLVAAAVADTPCAIDVESLARLRGRELPLSSLHLVERGWLEEQPDRVAAFASLWVRKEVLVKLGALSLDDAGDVDVTPSYDGLPVLGHRLLALDPGPHDAVAAWSSADDSAQ